jgi:hypothetical protein
MNLCCMCRSTLATVLIYSPMTMVKAASPFPPRLDDSVREHRLQSLCDLHRDVSPLVCLPHSPFPVLSSHPKQSMHSSLHFTMLTCVSAHSCLNMKSTCFQQVYPCSRGHERIKDEHGIRGIRDFKPAKERVTQKGVSVTSRDFVDKRGNDHMHCQMEWSFSAGCVCLSKALFVCRA